jgi:hypothetical protein
VSIGAAFIRLPGTCRARIHPKSAIRQPLGTFRNLTSSYLSIAEKSCHSANDPETVFKRAQALYYPDII